MNVDRLLAGCSLLFALGSAVACSAPAEEAAGPGDTPAITSTSTAQPTRTTSAEPGESGESDAARRAIEMVGVDPCSLLTEEERDRFFDRFGGAGEVTVADSTDGPLAECTYGAIGYSVSVVRPTKDSWYNPYRIYGSRVDVGGGWEAYINPYGVFVAKRGETSVGVHPHMDLKERLSYDELLELGKILTSRL